MTSWVHLQTGLPTWDGYTTSTLAIITVGDHPQLQVLTLTKDKVQRCFLHLNHTYILINDNFVNFTSIITLILFYSILFYSIIFYYIPFYSIPFHNILLYSFLFYSIPFHNILFYSFLFYSIPFHSILFYSIPFSSSQFYSVVR